MKILVIQMQMIGDVLTSSILFEALRKKYPNAELHYLIYKHTIPVVENNPFIDKLIIFDPDKNKSLRGLIPIITHVKGQKYDILIDVYSKINTALISHFSGIPVKIGYEKWYTRFAYTKTYNRLSTAKTEAGLAIEKRMQLLQEIDSTFPVQIRPKIYLSQSEKNQAETALQEAGISLERDICMISILGSSAPKSYPPAYMAQFLDRLARQTKAQLLFNYIPSQLEQVREIYALCQPQTQEQIFIDFYAKSLREFLAITSHCQAMIGNEGGAINMAKALDIPTFAIFAPVLKKSQWNIFDDGKKHMSVHLEDFKPDLFKEKPRKKLKKKNEALYRLFKPELMEKEIQKFLQYNLE